MTFLKTERIMVYRMFFLDGNFVSGFLCTLNRKNLKKLKTFPQNPRFFSRGLGSVTSSSSGVRGRAPTENSFGAFSAWTNTFDGNKFGISWTFVACTNECKTKLYCPTTCIGLQVVFFCWNPETLYLSLSRLKQCVFHLHVHVKPFLSPPQPTTAFGAGWKIGFKKPRFLL